MIAVQVKDSGERWPGARAFASDIDLLAALRRGDEAAFALLIDRYQNALLRVAMRQAQSRV